MSTQILVVEDDNAVATNLRHELTDLGYEVPATASSAEEALRLAEAAQPDLVLMDIVLNGRMDGIETSAELRERADVPIVYLTAHADDATLRRAKITEPYGYLIKPYEEQELRTTIETALFKHRMEQLSAAMKRWLHAVFRSIGDALVVTAKWSYFTNNCRVAVCVHLALRSRHSAWTAAHFLRMESHDVRSGAVLPAPVSRRFRRALSAAGSTTHHAARTVSAGKVGVVAP